MFVIIIGVLSTIVISIKFFYNLIFPNISCHKYGYEEKWYGAEESSQAKEENNEIQAFEINIPQEVLDDLKLRLSMARYENSLKDSTFQYGFNTNYLRKVTEYWISQYDWRKQEKDLNKYNHFKTNIEGLNIHFMHVKPTLPKNSELKVIPLMIIHGWPGSFLEFMKTVPHLTTPQKGQSFVFEIICPSIPGFGFSDSPQCKGFNARAAARIFVTLMERLGYHKFYVQGGDWGSYIASLMARYYSPRISGLHVNCYFFKPYSWDKLKFLLVAFFPFIVSKLERQNMHPLSKALRYAYEETGYFHIQSTKPDTIGCAMSDSPVGLAAYLLEKFSVATNKEFLKLSDGGLTNKFSLDELITSVMIYWVNNNFTSAARFYKENLHDIFYTVNEKMPVTVPCGVALFPGEPLMFPRMVMSTQMKNIVSFSYMPKGGHFAAMEEPQLFAEDIIKFVNIVEKKEKRLK